MSGNRILLIFLLVGFTSIGFSGCSSSEDAAPCYYTYMDFGDKSHIKRIPVQCTGPIALDSIYGRKRFEVDSVLGAPNTPEKEKGQSDWYRGGGIIIVYAGEWETATVISIQPENLEFTPESILEFLSITLDEKPSVSNKRDICWFDTPYGKIMANSRNDNPRLVDSMDILP